MPQSSVFSSESGWTIAWVNILLMYRYIITPKRFNPVIHEHAFLYLRAVFIRRLPSSHARAYLQASDMFHLLNS